jgi:hypothetical protein
MGIVRSCILPRRSFVWCRDVFGCLLAGIIVIRASYDSLARDIGAKSRATGLVGAVVCCHRDAPDSMVGVYAVYR